MNLYIVEHLMPTKVYDCIIIGAGPAGLTAAIYLARFGRNTLVLHSGTSRARLIPVSHNCPGFPNGISGDALLKRLTRQARNYETKILKQKVNAITRSVDNIFSITANDNIYYCQYIILATGVSDVMPKIPNINALIKAELMRHCPVCDGYEAINKNVAIIANDSHGFKEALFLRGYTDKVTLLSLGAPTFLSQAEQQIAQQANIIIINKPIKNIRISNHKVIATTESTNEQEYTFDTAYAALGSNIHGGLVYPLTVQCNFDGCIITDEHQQTTITRALCGWGCCCRFEPNLCSDGASSNRSNSYP